MRAGVDSRQPKGLCALDALPSNGGAVSPLAGLDLAVVVIWRDVGDGEGVDLALVFLARAPTVALDVLRREDEVRFIIAPDLQDQMASPVGRKPSIDVRTA